MRHFLALGGENGCPDFASTPEYVSFYHTLQGMYLRLLYPCGLTRRGGLVGLSESLAALAPGDHEKPAAARCMRSQRLTRPHGAAFGTSAPVPLGVGA